MRTNKLAELIRENSEIPFSIISSITVYMYVYRAYYHNDGTRASHAASAARVQIRTRARVRAACAQARKPLERLPAPDPWTDTIE